MKDYPVYALADTIIHETLHATVYVKGQSQFDEELAEFVGAEGARLYMADRFGEASPEYKEMLDRKLDNAAFVAFIQRLTRELEALYTGGAPTDDMSRAEKLARKEAIIKAAQERFSADYEAMFKSDRYRFFAGMQVNNAYLGLFRLYYDGGDYLKDLYEQSGSDLVKFVAAAKTIGRTKKPQEALERALTDF
jgi:predicted aminopeptidase